MQKDTIKESLAHFYSAHADDFSRSRKKHRPEIDRIVTQINSLPQDTIRILELGCGDGRLLSYIEKNCDKTIHYTGVDIAEGLIQLAQKNHKKGSFVCSDMTAYIDRQKQESYDCIISIAAFQHIPTKQERHYVTKVLYSLLKYDGMLAMTNRSWSQRFIQKYRKQIGKALMQSMISHQSKRNDVYIPRKSEKQVHHRYYHIFTKPEIQFLLEDAGFYIKELYFSTRNGGKTSQRYQAKNTILIAEKTTHDFLGS